MDVVNTRANLRAEIVFLKSGKNCKVSAACFKCDYVRVHVVNVFDNVVEFAVAHVCMNLGFWSYAGIAQSRYSVCQSECRSGSFSRNAASSIWMILIPFFSRSRTSSRIASAICITCVFRLMSSRGNDQFKIVTGPVNIPFTGALVQLYANVDHSTVMLIFLKRRPILPAVLRSVFHKEEIIKARVEIERLK